MIEQRESEAYNCLKTRVGWWSEERGLELASLRVSNWLGRGSRRVQFHSRDPQREGHCSPAGQGSRGSGRERETGQRGQRRVWRAGEEKLEID